MDDDQSIYPKLDNIYSGNEYDICTKQFEHLVTSILVAYKKHGDFYINLQDIDKSQQRAEKKIKRSFSQIEDLYTSQQNKLIDCLPDMQVHVRILTDNDKYGSITLIHDTIDMKVQLVFYFSYGFVKDTNRKRMYIYNLRKNDRLTYYEWRLNIDYFSNSCVTDGVSIIAPSYNHGTNNKYKFIISDDFLRIYNMYGDNRAQQIDDRDVEKFISVGLINFQEQYDQHHNVKRHYYLTDNFNQLLARNGITFSERLDVIINIKQQLIGGKIQYVLTQITTLFPLLSIIYINYQYQQYPDGFYQQKFTHTNDLMDTMMGDKNETKFNMLYVGNQHGAYGQLFDYMKQQISQSYIHNVNQINGAYYVYQSNVLSIDTKTQIIKKQYSQQHICEYNYYINSRFSICQLQYDLLSDSTNPSIQQLRKQYQQELYYWDQQIQQLENYLQKYDNYHHSMYLQGACNEQIQIESEYKQRWIVINMNNIDCEYFSPQLLDQQPFDDQHFRNYVKQYITEYNNCYYDSPTYANRCYDYDYNKLYIEHHDCIKILQGITLKNYSIAHKNIVKNLILQNKQYCDFNSVKYNYLDIDGQIILDQEDIQLLEDRKKREEKKQKIEEDKRKHEEEEKKQQNMGIQDKQAQNYEQFLRKLERAKIQNMKYLQNKEQSRWNFIELHPLYVEGKDIDEQYYQFYEKARQKYIKDYKKYINDINKLLGDIEEYEEKNKKYYQENQKYNEEYEKQIENIKKKLQQFCEQNDVNNAYQLLKLYQWNINALKLGGQIIRAQESQDKKILKAAIIQNRMKNQ